MRALLLIVALCGVAHAQAPGEKPVLPRDDADDKSIATAYLTSVAATTLPLAVFVIGAPENERAHPTRAAVFGSLGIAALVLGPSAGHWYAHRTITTGLVLRGVAAAGIATLAIADPHGENLGALIVGGVAAVGTWEVGVIWDFATLPRSVRRYNRERRQLQLAPLVAPSTTGLALAGTF